MTIQGIPVEFVSRQEEPPMWLIHLVRAAKAAALGQESHPDLEGAYIYVPEHIRKLAG